MIKREIQILLTSVMFYTRIPVPPTIKYSDEMLNKATRYFPFVGLIIGGITALIYYGLSFVFPVALAIVFSIAAGILFSGAFHEDGFADVCDGFGGGWTKQERLSIMKDSRIGTYGTVGLILILLTKFICLNELPVKTLPLIMIAAHSFSRFVPVITIFFGKYAREDLTSKVKPIGNKIGVGGFIFSFIVGILPLFLFKNWLFILATIIPLIIGFAFMPYFNKRIGGYTGDCLGAIQQVCEICVYISFVLLFKFLV